jgi:hypothetical protein
MAERANITAAQLRAILDYNPQTGVFVWLTRPPEMFAPTMSRTAEHACEIWNAKFAGTIAGSPNGEGYERIKIFGRPYLAHRLAWLYETGCWPEAQIDHINLDRSDTRFANLREATRSQNKANIRALSTNKSGFKGVYWSKRDKKWKAAIMVNRKPIFVGLFGSREAASDAYAQAAKQHFGEFARL